MMERWNDWKTNIAMRENVACILIYIGIFVLPMNVRAAISNDSFGYYKYINICVLVATVILMRTKKEYSRLDKMAIILWLVLLVIQVFSDRDTWTSMTITFILNCWLPAYLMLYRFQQLNVQKLLKYMLMAFNIFVVVLLVMAIIDRFCGNAMIYAMNSIFNTSELNSYLAHIINNPYEKRFYSLWGHALTNAIFFNAFFILNDIYYTNLRQKYHKIIYFVIALAGVLLCSGKTAITVLVIYMVISCLKDWKVLVLGGVAGVILYVVGAFDSVIQRFTSGSLTTGRLEVLKAYFSGDFPALKFWSGYGTNAVYEMVQGLKAGFEFPFMMYGFHYGILFSILAIVLMYGYVTIHMVRQKRVTSWFGYTLLFMQIYTYNGICLFNQDVYIFLSVISMIVINCVYLNPEQECKRKVVWIP